MATYIVKFSYPTRIPGYEPEWTDHTGDDFARAYEFGLARAKAIGMSANRECRFDPDYAVFYTALRDVELFGNADPVVLRVRSTHDNAVVGTVTVEVA